MKMSLRSADAVDTGQPYDDDDEAPPRRPRRPYFASHLLTAHEKKKQAMRRYKQRLVEKGRCRQCTAMRGASPSASRCTKCYEAAREQLRNARGAKPYRPGRHGGRPPLDWKGRMAAERQIRAKRESTREVFGTPIDRGGEGE